MKDKNKTPSEPTFLQLLTSLPEVMKNRFLRQMLAAIMVAGFTIVLLVYYKVWQFCIGFIMALYLAFLGMDIVWSYQRGKIVCRRMVCIKANTILQKGRIFVIMQDEGATTGTTDNTKQFYIITNKKNAALITPQTVMDIYYNENNPLEVTAWEIVGNRGSQ